MANNINILLFARLPGIGTAEKNYRIKVSACVDPESLSASISRCTVRSLEFCLNLQRLP